MRLELLLILISPPTQHRSSSVISEVDSLSRCGISADSDKTMLFTYLVRKSTSPEEKGGIAPQQVPVFDASPENPFLDNNPITPASYVTYSERQRSALNNDQKY